MKTRRRLRHRKLDNCRGYGTYANFLKHVKFDFLKNKETIVDLDKILKDLALYLYEHPEDGGKVFDKVVGIVDKPEFTGMSCPFCCEAVYLYKRTGKKVCSCDPGYGGMS